MFHQVGSPRFFFVAIFWMATFLVMLALPHQASAAEVPLSETPPTLDVEETADEPDDGALSPPTRRRLGERYQGFRIARVFSVIGIGTVGAGAVIAGAGVAGIAGGLMTMLLTLSVEPGLTILAYSFLGIVAGTGIVVVGGLVMATGVISMTFALNKLGAEVPYIGLVIAGIGVLFVSSAIIANATAEGDPWSPLLAGGLILFPAGLATQFVMTNIAFRQYRKEHITVRVAPQVGPNQWGLALAGSF